MDHIKILKRAFDITKSYRVLWIFGIILALTTGSGGSNPSNAGNNAGNRGTITPPSNFKWPNELPENFHWPSFDFLAGIASTLIVIGIVLACIVLLLIIIGAIARYVSETSLIRMVDHYEDSEEKLGFRQGFRLGWSRAAWRIFLIDLLITVVVIAVLIPVILIALLPLLAWTSDSTALGIAGTVATVGMVLLIIFVGILAGIALSLLLHFFRRVCILENRGVVDSIRRGFSLARERPWEIILMGLILFGIQLGWIILMVLVAIALVIIGLVVGGIPALIAGGIASLVSQGATPWIVAAVVGVPIFIFVIAAPMLFMSGLMEVYKSSTWTLTYRELLVLEKNRADALLDAPVPEVGEPISAEPEADVGKSIPAEPETGADEPVE